MASGHHALVLTVLFLMASHAAAETPSAGESGASASAQPQVCVEIDRFAKDYSKGFAMTIASPGSDLEKCKAATAYSDAVAKLVMFLQRHHQTCREQKRLAQELLQERTGAQRTRDRICAQAGVAPLPPPGVCAEIDRLARDYWTTGFAMRTIMPSASNLEKCRVTEAYSEAVSKLAAAYQHKSGMCGIEDRIAAKLPRESTEAERTKRRNCGLARWHFAD